MTTFSRPPVSLLNPIQGLIPDSGDIHFRLHALDSDSDHSGQLLESKILFSPTSGHVHDGIDAAKLSHSDLLGIGLHNHIQIDSHLLNRTNPHQVTAAQTGAPNALQAIAAPQTEQSVGAVSSSVYQLRALAPIFVGRTSGIDPNALVALIEVDGTKLMVGGVQVTIIKVTSDSAGNDSVIGLGYYANPYLHLSAIPSKVIRMRYGIESSLGSIPESLLLNEPIWVGETDADIRGLIADIKGMAYDAAVPDDDDLGSLAIRISAIESEIDIATSASLVFKADIISSINNTVESATIDPDKIGNISESHIIDGGILARVDANELITGNWTFNGGPIIEHGSTLPAQAESGRLFIKSDTKTLYIADGIGWNKVNYAPRHIRIIGDGISRQWLISEATANNNSIWVFRQMLLQDKDMGQYAEAQDGVDVRITFPEPIPLGIVIIFKVF
jgi:hypothetical protein